MKFRLGVVGYDKMITLVEAVVKKNFNEIEVIAISLSDLMALSQSNTVADAVFPKIDGILYARKEDYLLMGPQIKHTVPVRYIEISNEQMAIFLLRTVMDLGNQLKTISIDFMDIKNIYESFSMAEIDHSVIDIQQIPFQVFQEHGNQGVIQQHLNNYSNQADLCLTNSFAIYHKLKLKKLPCYLVVPSKNAIIHEIRSLMLRKQLIQSQGNDVVMIYLCLRYKEKLRFYPEIQMKEAEELSRVSRFIQLYTNSLDGATFTISRWEYVLLCDEKMFRDTTKQFSDITLMANIAKSTSFEGVFAIGIGTTIKEMYRNAMTSYAHSVVIRNTNAVITIGDKHILPPIISKSDKFSNVDEEETHLLKISKEAGIGMTSLDKIYMASKIQNTMLFTSTEIASILDVSVRTANRIVERFLDTNHASLEGSIINDQKGRPKRVIRFHF